MSDWRTVAYPYESYLLNLKTLAVKPAPYVRTYGSSGTPKRMRPLPLSKTPEGKYKLKSSVDGGWRRFHPVVIYDVTMNRLVDWPENRQGKEKDD